MNLTKDFIKDVICPEFNLDFDKIINVYRYGSFVYGTENKDSDEDFIIIYKQKEFKIDAIKNKSGKINITLYSLPGFKNSIYYNEISVLECIFLEDKYKWESVDINYYFKNNKKELRKSISSKASHSWVKSKKKFIFEGESLIAQKSAFHSLRIFHFGIQIAKFGKIIDYKTGFKKLLDDIKTIKEWKQLKNKYQPEFNRLHSEFKKLTS